MEAGVLAIMDSRVAEDEQVIAPVGGDGSPSEIAG
jgi:hypothetical protein